MPSYLLTTKRPSCSASKTRIRRGFSPFSEVLVFLIAAGRSLLEIIVVLNDRPDCDARDWWQSEALHHSQTLRLVAIYQEDGCAMNNTEARAAPDTRRSDDPVALVARLSDERAADIVEALNDLAPNIAAAVLLELPPERCPCRKPYPAWQSIENRTMIACNEGSLQAHWLDGCGSDPVAGNA